MFTNQQAFQRWTLPQTTSHILSHNSHLHPGILAPQERCSPGSQQPYRSAPSQSATKVQESVSRSDPDRNKYVETSQPLIGMFVSQDKLACQH